MEYTDKGHVVGQSNIEDGNIAFIWTAEEGMMPIGSTEYNTSSAWAINNKEVVAGNTTVSGPPFSYNHGFIWTAEDGMMDIGALNGNRSGLRDINDLGHAVGSSWYEEYNSHAILWTAEQGIEDIDPGIFGGDQSTAFSINNHDQVVGYFNSSELWSIPGVSTERHAFLWTANSGMLDLNGLIETDSGFILTDAIAINDNGVILAEGYIKGENGIRQAFLLTPVPIPSAALLLGTGLVGIIGLCKRVKKY